MWGSDIGVQRPSRSSFGLVRQQAYGRLCRAGPRQSDSWSLWKARVGGTVQCGWNAHPETEVDLWVGVEEAWRMRRVKGEKLKHPVSESRKVEQRSQTQKCPFSFAAREPARESRCADLDTEDTVAWGHEPPPLSFNRRTERPGKVTSQQRSGGTADQLCWNL